MPQRSRRSKASGMRARGHVDAGENYPPQRSRRSKASGILDAGQLIADRVNASKKQTLESVWYILTLFRTTTRTSSHQRSRRSKASGIILVRREVVAQLIGLKEADARKRLVLPRRSGTVARTLRLKEADARKRLVFTKGGSSLPAKKWPQRSRRSKASGIDRDVHRARAGRVASKKQTLESVWYAAYAGTAYACLACLKEADARKRLVSDLGYSQLYDADGASKKQTLESVWYFAPSTRQFVPCA